MLESFVSTQKMGVQKALQKKFRQFISYKKDFVELLMATLQVPPGCHSIVVFLCTRIEDDHKNVFIDLAMSWTQIWPSCLQVLKCSHFPGGTSCQAHLLDFNCMSSCLCELVLHVQALMREQLRIEQMQGSSPDGLLKVTCRWTNSATSTSIITVCL